DHKAWDNAMKEQAIVKWVRPRYTARKVKPGTLSSSQTDKIRRSFRCSGIFQAAGKTSHAGGEVRKNAVRLASRIKQPRGTDSKKCRTDPDGELKTQHPDCHAQRLLTA